MLKALAAYCRRIDVERTSVWTFAQTGHREVFLSHADTFLGFGVSATTLLKDSFKINTFSIEDYIERVNAGVLPTSLTFVHAQAAGCLLLVLECLCMKINRISSQK